MSRDLHSLDTATIRVLSVTGTCSECARLHGVPDEPGVPLHDLSGRVVATLFACGAWVPVS